MAAQPTELFWVSGTPFPALGRRRGSSARTKRSTLIQLAKYRIKPSNKELGREGWSRAALPSGRGSQPSDMDASEHHLRAMPTKRYHCEPPISTSSADETFCETPCGTPVLSPEKKSEDVEEALICRISTNLENPTTMQHRWNGEEDGHKE